MMNYLNKALCQAICVLSGVTSISATALLIAGFINMATYFVTTPESCVGLWTGFIMFAHIFLGLLVMASRNLFVNIPYLVTSLTCVAVGIYGMIESFDFYEDFKDYNDYVKDTTNTCQTFTNLNQCVCPGGKSFPLVDYKVTACSLYSFGEDLWLAIFVLIAVNIACASIGAILAFVATLRNLMGSDKKEDRKGNYPVMKKQKQNRQSGIHQPTTSLQHYGNESPY